MDALSKLENSLDRLLAEKERAERENGALREEIGNLRLEKAALEAEIAALKERAEKARGVRREAVSRLERLLRAIAGEASGRERL